MDSLSGHISGFIEEEYSGIEKEEKTNKRKGTASVGILKGDFGRDSTIDREITRAGTISPEIRYKNSLDSLIDLGLEQIDTFDKHLWDMLVNEDEFIEIRGSMYFTEVYDLERQASLIGNLGSDLGFIDKDEVEKVMIN